MARSSRAEWAKRVERWKDSGLTAKEFASETGLNPSTLSYWSWRLGRAKNEAESKPRRARPAVPGRKRAEQRRSAQFVELSLPAVSASAPMLEVVVGDVRVRVPVGVDEATLARVVRAVGAGR